MYAPIRQGSDIAFLLGVINHCIQNDKVQWEYTKAYTNAPYVVKEGYGTPLVLPGFPALGAAGFGFNILPLSTKAPLYETLAPTIHT